MRLVEFGSVVLPGAQHVAELPREARIAYLEPTGALFGERDLYEAGSPLGNQRYRAEFLFVGDQRAQLDALLALVGQRRWLVQRTATGALRATLAKLIRCEIGGRPEDAAARIIPGRCEFVAEPYWYSNPVTVSFSNALTALIIHQGNARCVRHLIIRIDTNLPSDGLRITSQNCEITYIAATSAPLVIDVGNHAVQVGGANAFQNVRRPDTQIPLFWLQPGENRIIFSRLVSGSVTFRHTYV